MAKQRNRRSQRAATVPVALTIAGSDSSAGAGIQADLKTFSALGVYGLTAITCVVAETPGRVLRIEPINPEVVYEQVAVLARNFPIAAAKTGLLCSGEIVEAVARGIDLLRKIDNRIPVVVDPVTVATSGDMLLSPEAMEIYERELFPIVTLLTPNLEEAGKLIDEPIRDLETMRKAGKQLQQKYQVSILLKGGHLAGDDAIDLLFAGDRISEFSAPFVRGVVTHGTGCTYSAAITAALASGLSLEAAVRRAKEFVTASIAKRLRWKSKSGENIDALNHSLYHRAGRGRN